MFPQCRDCVAINTKRWNDNADQEVLRVKRQEYYVANREAFRLKRKATRSTPEHKEWLAGYIASQGDAYYEKARLRTKAWALANPDKAAATQKLTTNRRRARLKSCIAVRYSNAEWLQRVAVLGNECFYCGVSGEEAKLSMDHVIAISNGGPDILANLRPACRSCNSAKSARDHKSWTRGCRVAA